VLTLSPRLPLTQVVSGLFSFMDFDERHTASSDVPVDCQEPKFHGH
jgi:hypothetical protein